MPANYWAEFIYDSCTIVLNVGWHAQVQGGFGGVGVEIGFCHWTGLAPLLHLHLQLCPPPIGPPKPTLGMDSPMLETEGQCGAGHSGRVEFGFAARVVPPAGLPGGPTTERVEMEAVGWKAQWGWRWSEQWEWRRPLAALGGMTPCGGCEAPPPLQYSQWGAVSGADQELATGGN